MASFKSSRTSSHNLFFKHKNIIKTAFQRICTTVQHNHNDTTTHDANNNIEDNDTTIGRDSHTSWIKFAVETELWADMQDTFINH